MKSTASILLISLGFTALFVGPSARAEAWERQAEVEAKVWLKEVQNTKTKAERMDAETSLMNRTLNKLYTKSALTDSRRAYLFCLIWAELLKSPNLETHEAARRFMEKALASTSSPLFTAVASVGGSDRLGKKVPGLKIGLSKLMGAMIETLVAHHPERLGAGQLSKKMVEWVVPLWEIDPLRDFINQVLKSADKTKEKAGLFDLLLTRLKLQEEVERKRMRRPFSFDTLDALIGKLEFAMRSADPEVRRSARSAIDSVVEQLRPIPLNDERAERLGRLWGMSYVGRVRDLWPHGVFNWPQGASDQVGSLAASTYRAFARGAHPQLQLLPPLNLEIDDGPRPVHDMMRFLVEFQSTTPGSPSYWNAFRQALNGEDPQQGLAYTLLVGGDFIRLSGGFSLESPAVSSVPRDLIQQTLELSRLFRQAPPALPNGIQDAIGGSTVRNRLRALRRAAATPWQRLIQSPDAEPQAEGFRRMFEDQGVPIEGRQFVLALALSLQTPAVVRETLAEGINAHWLTPGILAPEVVEDLVRAGLVPEDWPLRRQEAEDPALASRVAEVRSLFTAGEIDLALVQRMAEIVAEETTHPMLRDFIARKLERDWVRAGRLNRLELASLVKMPPGTATTEPTLLSLRLIAAARLLKLHFRDADTQTLLGFAYVRGLLPEDWRVRRAEDLIEYFRDTLKSGDTFQRAEAIEAFARLATTRHEEILRLREHWHQERDPGLKTRLLTHLQHFWNHDSQLRYAWQEELGEHTGQSEGNPLAKLFMALAPHDPETLSAIDAHYGLGPGIDPEFRRMKCNGAMSRLAQSERGP